jgi:hypothetical protein
MDEHMDDEHAELKQAAEEAFPDSGEWTDDRLAALKELIKMCSGADYGEEESEGESPHKETLALLFGKPKK